MAQTKVRREVTITHYKANRATYDPVTGEAHHEEVTGSLAGSYTTKRLLSTLNKTDEAHVYSEVSDVTYEVNEYEMSLADFIRYGTRK